MPYKDIIDEEYNQEQREYYGIEDQVDTWINFQYDISLL